MSNHHDTAQEAGEGAPPWANDRRAPGGPGAEPHWTSGAKDGVGTALCRDVGATSLVWFTVDHGVFDEIFYPRLDRACVRELGLAVTDGGDFFSDEKHDARHEIAWLAEGAPGYLLTNTCNQGRYRVEKRVIAHPHQDAVLQQTRFIPLKGGAGDYRLYVLLAPHLGNQGSDNTAWLGAHKGVPVLFAEGHGCSLALACSAPWLRGSAGFVGASDGLQDLARHKRLTECYGRAESGNVALTGEVDLAASGGEFVLSLGFGPDPSEAAHRALSGLLDDFGALEKEYVRGWRDWQTTLAPLEPPGTGGRDLYRVSTAVLRVHDAATVPGAVIASLALPWGETQGDLKPRGAGGYHLVWPRDLAEAAGALLAAGATGEALRVFHYLRATQEADGHWPQNMWVSGEKYWDGIQLGETALPVLLVDRLLRAGALGPEDRRRVWPAVRRAAGYIARVGPATQEDRWENERGYTPFTLGSAVAALLAAADLADEVGEGGVGTYLRETADAWCGGIESWLYVTDTPLARRAGVEGYYARIIHPELVDLAAPRGDRLRLKAPPPEHKGTPVTEIVSPDALALVRFGLRAPDDPRILNTVKVIDALLRVETPCGPSWYRYNGDGYGEHEDGAPYVMGSKLRGKGRLWPLLTGERAHYELAAGRRDEAIRLLRALEDFAGDGGMIPEQVWDADDLPDRDLFRGRPTGSAMPLVWAHAEYVTLRRSLQDGRLFDLPPQTVRRYLVEKVGVPYAFWRFNHQVEAVQPGASLRVELLAPALIRWSLDGGRTTEEADTRDTGLSLHVLDLPAAQLPPGGALEFTIRWNDTQKWEPRTFTVTVK